MDHKPSTNLVGAPLRDMPDGIYMDSLDMCGLVTLELWRYFSSVSIERQVTMVALMIGASPADVRELLAERSDTVPLLVALRAEGVGEECMVRLPRWRDPLPGRVVYVTVGDHRRRLVYTGGVAGFPAATPSSDGVLELTTRSSADQWAGPPPSTTLIGDAVVKRRRVSLEELTQVSALAQMIVWLQHTGIVSPKRLAADAQACGNVRWSWRLKRATWQQQAAALGLDASIDRGPGRTGVLKVTVIRAHLAVELDIDPEGNVGTSKGPGALFAADGVSREDFLTEEYLAALPVLERASTIARATRRPYWHVLMLLLRGRGRMLARWVVAVGEPATTTVTELLATARAQEGLVPYDQVHAAGQVKGVVPFAELRRVTPLAGLLAGLPGSEAAVKRRLVRAAARLDRGDAVDLGRLRRKQIEALLCLEAGIVNAPIDGHLVAKLPDGTPVWILQELGFSELYHRTVTGA